MRLDVASLQRFYASPLGETARRLALARLSAAWEDAADLDLLGIGFPGPYLESFPDARRRVIVMPAEQGACRWPGAGRGAAVLAEETRLPLMDNLFDRVLLAHALEDSEAPTRLLREVWRVTAPEGRIVVMVANRVGLWSLNEAQPFGHGRPYTRTQLARLLRNNLFEPVATARALYLPPLPWRPALALANTFERLGGLLTPGLGGVLFMEAIKRVSAPPAQAEPMFLRRPLSKPALPPPRETVNLGAMQHRESR